MIWQMSIEKKRERKKKQRERELTNKLAKKENVILEMCCVRDKIQDSFK